MLDPVLAKTAIANIYNGLVGVRPATSGGIRPQP